MQATILNPGPVPASIVAILDRGLDVVARHRAVEAECARLGVGLLYESARESAAYGTPIAAYRK
jgi:hypothetical protein